MKSLFNKDYKEFLEELKTEYCDVVAEKTTLCGLLHTTQNDVVGLFENIDEEYFTDPLYKNVYKAIRGIFKARRTPDKATIISVLTKNNIEVNQEDMQDIGLLFEANLDTFNLDMFIDDLKKHYSIRKVEEQMYLTRLQFKEAKTLEDVDSIAKQTSNKIESVNIVKKDIAEQDSASIIENMNLLYEQAQEDPMLNFGLRTGFTEFDIDINGIKKGDFGLITGPTGGGKSISGANFSYNVSKKWNFEKNRFYRVLYIDLEMRKEKFNLRLDALISGYSINLIKTGQLDDIAMAHRKTEQTKFVLRNSYFTCNEPSQTMDQIESLIKRYIIQYDIDVVVLDYISKIKRTRDEAKAPQDQTLGNYGQRLKDLASGYGIRIVGLEQLNRASETAKVLGKEHIAGSYELIRHCDFVMATKPNEDEEDDNTTYEKKDLPQEVKDQNKKVDRQWKEQIAKNGLVWTNTGYLMKTRDGGTPKAEYAFNVNSSLTMTEIKRNTELSQLEKETRELYYRLFKEQDEKEAKCVADFYNSKGGKKSC